MLMVLLCSDLDPVAIAGCDSRTDTSDPTETVSRQDQDNDCLAGSNLNATNTDESGHPGYPDS